MPASAQHYPLRLTQAQRKVVAEIVPEIAGRLKLEEPDQRTMRFTVEELKIIQEKAAAEERNASTGMKRTSLRHVNDLTTQAIDHSQGIGAIAASERLYQFTITLKDACPPIWRRIQVKDCTLDKFHEYIQTAMGWTNSHLHDFHLGEQRYGDPLLMQENFVEMNYVDSTIARLSQILPKTGKRFLFEYVYDFGDCWQHEVLFEGCVRADPGRKYPICVEGARACPPEDVGGVRGYREYLEAMADPSHERHEEFIGWRGPFDPEAFDLAVATKAMKKGLPAWRKEEWI